MAYRFSGGTANVEFSNAPLVGYTMGPFTLAFFYKPADIATGNQMLWYTMNSLAADKSYLHQNATVLTWAGPLNPGDSSASISSTSPGTWRSPPPPAAAPSRASTPTTGRVGRTPPAAAASATAA